METIVAEKIVTAVTRGEANTRDRDWADLWRLTGTHPVAGATITDALRRTADFRQITLAPLTQRLGALAELRAASYRRWRSNQGVDRHAYPSQFTQVLHDVTAFADPTLNNEVSDHHWDPSQRRWRPHR